MSELIPGKKYINTRFPKNGAYFYIGKGIEEDSLIFESVVSGIFIRSFTDIWTEVKEPVTHKKYIYWYKYQNTERGVIYTKTLTGKIDFKNQYPDRILVGVTEAIITEFP